MKLSKVAKYQSIDTVKTSFSDHNAIKLEKKLEKLELSRMITLKSHTKDLKSLTQIIWVGVIVLWVMYLPCICWPRLNTQHHLQSPETSRSDFWTQTKEWVLRTIWWGIPKKQNQIKFPSKIVLYNIKIIKCFYVGYFLLYPVLILPII